MSADTIQEREVGELIAGIQTEHCVKNCDVHPYMKQGVIKSLRIGEENTRLHRWSLLGGICALISIWMKGVPVVDTVVAVSKMFVSK